MPGSDPELEREHSLTNHDPLVKQRPFQRTNAQREERLKEPYTRVNIIELIR